MSLFSPMLDEELLLVAMRANEYDLEGDDNGKPDITPREHLRLVKEEDPWP